jgi:hypothetical protein
MGATDVKLQPTMADTEKAVATHENDLGPLELQNPENDACRDPLLVRDSYRHPWLSEHANLTTPGHLEWR